MKKILFSSVLLALSFSAFAGPISGGGPSEAPWVASQEIFGKVLSFMSNHNMAPAFIKDEFNGSVSAGILCSGKTVRLLFKVETTCNPNISIICAPERSVTLDEEQSESCK